MTSFWINYDDIHNKTKLQLIANDYILNSCGFYHPTFIRKFKLIIHVSFHFVHIHLILYMSPYVIV